MDSLLDDLYFTEETLERYVPKVLTKAIRIV